jgi:hypothetical protein
VQRRDFIGYSSLAVGSFLVPSDLQAVQQLFTINQSEQINKPLNAKFIWSDSDGNGRNIYTNFRKKISLTEVPEKAIFNLFADSSYQLFINDVFVQQGPIRFDPRFPVYDSRDIAPYLKIGENVIAIQANYFGLKTYKSIANRAGFICWGEIKTSKENISLDSLAKNWKALKAPDREKFVGKLSFALNPTDLVDQRQYVQNWKSIDYNDSAWANAKEITLQNSWGNFTERPIQYMSGKDIPIVAIKKVSPLIKNEDLYSFSAPFPANDDDTKERRGREFYMPFQTWIYSPKKQTVSVGGFWGENWLNGQAVDGGVNSDKLSMRINRKFNFNQGWNYFFGKVGPYTDNLNHYFAFPKDAGLTISANKSLSDSSVVFKRMSEKISNELFAKHIEKKSLPFSENETILEVGGWIPVLATDMAQSPCVESSWDYYADPIEKIKSNQLSGKTFSKSDYPQGFSILMDIDYMHLAYPVLQAEGVKDATIDITYSEQLATDNEHLLVVFNYQPGDRVLCGSDKIDFMPSHPRGIRYLRLTFRNTKSDVLIKSFTIKSANYGAPKIGSFQSSDVLLNKIWEMCERTQEANMEDAYVDCSGRERGMYLRDTIIQYFNNLALYGDQALMRRCMELYLQSPDSTGKFRAVYPNSGTYTISDFCLNGLEGLKIYYQNTGDKELIKKYWTSIVNNLKWFDDLSDERPDGLLDSEWHIKRKINANYGGFHGDLGIIEDYMDNTDAHAVFSLTYIIALQAAEYLAREIGNQEYAQSTKKRIEKVSKGVINNLWNNDKKCVSDNVKKTTHSYHASLFAIRAGILDVEKFEYSKKYVKENFKNLFVNGYNPDAGVYSSPSYMFYIFDGLYLAGLEETAENLIKEAWGWCLFNGMSTVPEYFSTNPFQSMCHAWSASPVYYLSKYGLGVNFPQAPNLNHVEIRVKSSSLTSCEGKFPHPKGGSIDVKWHMENGKRVFDYVKAPNGVEVKVVG